MKITVLLILGAIVFWGLWGFFAKLAVQRIGIQTSMWNFFALITIIFTYLLMSNQLFPIKGDIKGISLALIAGVCSGLASVFFYILLGKKPVGFLVAATALYPLITIILSVLFLKEPLTITKIAGFVLALSALILLNL